MKENTGLRQDAFKDKEFQIEKMQRFIHAHIEEGNHGGDASHSDY